MRVLNNSDDVAPRVFEGSDPDVVADVGRLRMSGRTVGEQVGKHCLNVGHAPVGFYIFAFQDRAFGGLKAEFVATHFKANVEWLVEIGLDAKGLGIPSDCSSKLRHAVDASAEAEERSCHFDSILVANVGRFVF